jgi:hypothetical protein
MKGSKWATVQGNIVATAERVKGDMQAARGESMEDMDMVGPKGHL